MKKNRLFAIALLFTVVLGVWAQNGTVNYIYYTVNDDGKTVTRHTDGSQNTYNELTSTTNVTNSTFTNDGGWWVVRGEVTHAGRINVEKDTWIVLCDHANLSAGKGIYIKKDVTLTIVAESEGNASGMIHTFGYDGGAAIGGNANTLGGNLVIHGGEIFANGGVNNVAGIGGGNGENSGIQSVTIYGGDITVLGTNDAASIGKGKHNNHQEVVKIYGGTVKANRQDGADNGAGIGGSLDRGNGEVYIYGGTVTATGGAGAAAIGGGWSGDQDKPIYIYGGTVTAYGGNHAAGIGAGGESYGGGSSNTIEIHGGTVTARGGGNSGTQKTGAGIGSAYHGLHHGPILITGGTVMATGGWTAAGIGGGYGSSGGEITINGGNVEAHGGFYAAGIGGGSSIEELYGTDTDGGAGTITINGGIVRAFARNEAGESDCSKGAAIGSGMDGGSGSVTINGGLVYANSEDGAAIGGGYEGSVSTITINGGQVLALAMSGGAGIGGGRECTDNNCTIAISDGVVIAVGGTHKLQKEKTQEEEEKDDFWDHLLETFAHMFESMASGEGGFAEEMLSGFVLEAIKLIPKDDEWGGAGIGGGNNCDGCTVHITGGSVLAHGAHEGSNAIGHGYKGHSVGTLEISDAAMVVAGSDEEHSERTLAADRVTACRNNLYAHIQPCDHEGATNTVKDGLQHTVGTCTHCIVAAGTDENHRFGAYGECPACHLIGLKDNGDNAKAITHWNGQTKSVTLIGRTLYKDGAWNTLCLPFTISVLEGSPLRGATLKEFQEAEYAGSMLTLNFGTATSIQAGQPYLIKWGSQAAVGGVIGDDSNNGGVGNSYNNGSVGNSYNSGGVGSHIVNPLFEDVTISNTPQSVVVGFPDDSPTNVTFRGTYAPITSTTENRSILFLGDNNALYFPQPSDNKTPTIGAQRAYFQLAGLTAADVAQSRIVLRFVEDHSETTGIENDQCSMVNIQSDYWYDLQGRRVTVPSGSTASSVLPKGVYIKNNRKVIIR